MSLAWKGLLPLSIVNLFVVAIEVFIFNPGSDGLSTTDLWIMTGINWAITIIAIFVIFNLLGQKVKTLVSKTQNPGEYYFIWNGKDINGITMQSGIYFAVINRKSRSDVLKITFLK